MMTADDFAKAFDKWHKRWEKCIAVEGNYVEK